MAGKKYYAVLSGRKTGIFNTWDECKNAVRGYSGAQYKSFRTLGEAREYIGKGAVAAGDPSAFHSTGTGGRKSGKTQGGKSWASQIQKDREAGILVAFTDGSYEHHLKKYSYGVVLVEPNGRQHTLRGSGKQGDFLSARNVAGEVMGVLGALAWARRNGFHRVRIYHDYIGLASWAARLWQAKTPISMHYVREFGKESRGLDVSFQKVPAHSGVDLNELADRLAAQAMKEPVRECAEEERVASAGGSALSKREDAAGGPAASKRVSLAPGRTYVMRGHADLRKSAKTLLEIVRSAGVAPASGSTYVFRSKKGDRVKALVLDGGMSMLEAWSFVPGLYSWPQGEGLVRLDKADCKKLAESLRK